MKRENKTFFKYYKEKKHKSFENKYHNTSFHIHRGSCNNSRKEKKNVLEIKKTFFRA